MNNDRRDPDPRIDKILEIAISTSTNIALIKLDNENMKKQCAEHHDTLYDKDGGLCNTVRADHEQLGFVSKVVWGVSAVVGSALVGKFLLIVMK